MRLPNKSSQQAQNLSDSFQSNLDTEEPTAFSNGRILKAKHAAEYFARSRHKPTVRKNPRLLNDRNKINNKE